MKSVKPSELFACCINYEINFTNICRIRDKINNPPKDFNQQEVSKRFKSFIKLKESAKAADKKKQRKFASEQIKKIF